MSVSGLGEGPPRKLRGRAAREWEARAAQEAAVQAFYRMDRAQRDVRVQVESFANLAEDAALSERIGAEFAELSAEADNRAGRYLATLDAHPIEPDTSSGALGTAAAAFRQAAYDIGELAEDLTAFAEKHHPAFTRISVALDRLAAHTGAANRAMEGARAGMAALLTEGIPAGEADQAMREAEQVAAELADGSGRRPVSETAALADRVVTLAGRVRVLAEGLPRTKQEASRRTRTLRTRREAVGFQVAGIDAALRPLRREYSEGCWADLADAEPRAADLVTAADEELVAAGQAVDRGDWVAVAAAQTRAGARLDAAADRAAAVTNRRTLLEEVRADPAAAVSAARFTVRDAQRLVMQDRVTPPQPWAAELDALADRVSAAETALGGVHPDYWAFRTELARIGDATADLVRRFRAAPD